MEITNVHCGWPHHSMAVRYHKIIFFKLLIWRQTEHFMELKAWSYSILVHLLIVQCLTKEPNTVFPRK